MRLCFTQGYIYNPMDKHDSNGECRLVRRPRDNLGNREKAEARGDPFKSYGSCWEPGADCIIVTIRDDNTGSDNIDMVPLYVWDLSEEKG